MWGVIKRRWRVAVMHAPAFARTIQYLRTGQYVSGCQSTCFDFAYVRAHGYIVKTFIRTQEKSWKQKLRVDSRPIRVDSRPIAFASEGASDMVTKAAENIDGNAEKNRDYISRTRPNRIGRDISLDERIESIELFGQRLTEVIGKSQCTFARKPTTSEGRNSAIHE